MYRLLVYYQIFPTEQKEMQIEIPLDLFERVQQRAAMLHGLTGVDVIRLALDSLDWMDRERQTIQMGIDAWRAGDVQEFAAFDREFRSANGISTDP